jgi:Na+-driven multidrug efflux pump
VVSLIVGIPATRAYGIVGAVWGTNLADAGALLMMLWLLRRKIQSRVELVTAAG